MKKLVFDTAISIVKESVLKVLLKYDIRNWNPRKEKKQGKKERIKKEQKSEENVKENATENIKLKYGPSVRFPYQRVRQGKEIYVIKQKESLLRCMLSAGCLNDYEGKISKYSECIPKKCGIIATDLLVKSTNTMNRNINTNNFGERYNIRYTTLLYLVEEISRVVDLYFDKNNVKTIIEPRKGKVFMFTSGSENLHAIGKIQSGTRYALIVPFTCDPTSATPDPNYRTKLEK
ncbi:PREDICTED: LOW QUALITY PROTEIN: uncharacterized protein LOC108553586 [Eufriesea mexicana]|uniref:LOW QUALITY PROTEIN: uncharacterized protein LOC108553586 n=1 Tax=Eufriesea mexicana TaxID=516756 RepID=UPI00083BA94E|nr:PREDICTED: LOW QUALITY PROTEIN: uncharacterized protein LOC108553586 [Eufriesea mexicana]